MGRALSHWKDEYYVKIYELARSGMRNKTIARTIGVDYTSTFKVWIRKLPALAKALEQARGTVANTKTFLDYVYERLDPRLQVLWDEINRMDKSDSNQIEMIESFLEKAGMRARQHLFVHAFVASNFNLSEACRKVNITKRTFERWVTEDPEFGELFDEINWHKKNFCEGMLMALVAQADTTAVIFANRTLNRDRGYNPTKDVNITGHINHSMIPLERLPLELRKQIMEALEKGQQPDLNGLNMLPAHVSPEVTVPADDDDWEDKDED